MTIAEIRQKCKSVVARVPRDILILAVLIFASSASFGLGYIAGSEQGKGGQIVLETPDTAAPDSVGEVVASANGTKYYFPDCSGAARISDANKIWFTTAVAASAAGYTLASNCDAP